LARPVSLIQSVVQAGDSTVRTSARANPAPRSAATMSSRIASMAGHPE
jgi:hypothetical protein